ncbi:MAG: hypothetical protein WAM04_13855 [Candidatus Sulfotelmatobacter sp.]
MKTTIILPRPTRNAINKNRPISDLLKAQILHLHEAERKLPPRRRTEIYVDAIRTEREAAQYIRAVTEAIHEAHAAAVAKRLRPKRKGVIEIAAVAEDRPRKKGRGPDKSKPIEFSGHASQQLRFRGTTETEVVETIQTAPWMPAEKSRIECRKDFLFDALWNGRRYATKQVRPVFVEEPNEIVVVTVYVYYF